MQTKKTKSRNLSTYEYFQILQMEWLCADLRSRLYPKINKAFWNKVKEGKENTINTIAEKNQLPTIFTDAEMKRIFEFKLYESKGLPRFIYKSEEDKRKQEPLDQLYYFAKGSEVRFDNYGEQKIGKIKHYTPHSPTITLLIEDEEFVVDVNEVTRIL